MKFRARTKNGRLSQQRKLPTAEESMNSRWGETRLRSLVNRLPRSARWLADGLLEADPDKAAAAYMRLSKRRERWLRKGWFDQAAVIEELMCEAFVVGCDANDVGVRVAHPEYWNEQVEEELSADPIPRRKEEMDSRRIWSSKVLKDGRKRRGAWVTKWRGWVNQRGRLLERGDHAWVHLPALNAVETRPGTYVVCWVVRGEAWVLFVGHGRNVREAAQAKVFGLGYEVSDRRVAVAVHYAANTTRARNYAQDLAWLYAAPLNLGARDG